VEQIYRIVALRALGLSLAQIGAALDSAPALEQSLADQLARVEADITQLVALRTQLRAVLGSQHIALEELIGVIRKTVISQELLHEYLDDADRELLAHNTAGRADEVKHAVESEYPRLYRAAQEQMAAGVPPEAPPMQEIAAQLEALSRSFTGGDTGVSHKVQTMWSERSEEITGRDYTDLSEYVVAARAYYRANSEEDQ
jgi:DNA-binding transcriptional MerR regulator